MSSGSQRRRFRRYTVRLPFLHQSDSSTANGIRIGWTRDLSEGGACVEFDQPIPAPSHLQVRLQTDRGIIDAKAEVVWAGKSLTPDSGVPHGLVFVDMAPHQLQDLQYAFLSWGLTRGTGVRLPCRIAVTCQPKGETGSPLEGHTRDVSRAGTLLRLPRVVSPGTVLELTLHTQPAPVTTDGVVIWVAPPEGRTPGGLIRHGVRFRPLEWSSAVSLALDLVGRLGKTAWATSGDGVSYR